MKRRNKKGYTLVELIVTFMLSAMLLTAAATALTTFTKVFSQINDTSLAYTIMDTLTETVAGALGGAQRSNVSGENEEVAFMRIADGGSSVYYRDHNGYLVQVHLTEDGYLELFYNEIKNDAQQTIHKAVHWGLGEGVYNDYVIDTMSFSHIPSTNRLLMNLTIVNRTTGRSFSTERVIECYNVTSNDIAQK